MFHWFLAYKYSFRLITLAALLAVTFSVAVLIVVVSVMEGFRSELASRIRGSTSDIKIESTLFLGLEDPERVEALVREVPGVRSTARVLETLALFQRGQWRAGARTEARTEDRFLIGIDTENETAVRELDGYIAAVEPPEIPVRMPSIARMLEEIFARLPRTTAEIFSPEWLDAGLWRGWRGRPRASIAGPAEEPPLPAIVGVESVRQDSLLPGYAFQLTSFSPLPPYEPRTRKFYVAGYFKTGLYELDSKAIILRLADADAFLHLRGPDGVFRLSGIRVNAEESRTSEEVLTSLRADIEKKLASSDVSFVKVQTWREARSSLLDAVKIEKIIVSIILSVVILFAGFMIFIILTVQVVERSRDIGVLQSEGSTPAGIARIYFLVGSSLCLTGTVLGAVYGIAFAASINTIQRWVELLTGYELFPGDVYYIDRIPVRFSAEDILFIIVPTVAASLLASIVPALRAARRDPVVALRYE